MGFFDRVLGKQEAEAVSLKISELEGFLEKETLPQKQAVSGSIAARFAEIKHLLKSISVSLKQLEAKPFSSENNRLSAVVKTSKENTIKQLSSLIQRLQPPVQVEAKTAHSYCSDSLVLLQRETQFFGKNIAYTSIYMKEEVKQLGEELKELVETIDAMKKEIEGQKSLFAVEKILAGKKELLLQKQLQADAKQSASSLKATIASLEKQASMLQQEISEAQQSKEFSELAALQEKKSSLTNKKKELNTELLAAFSPVDKPLKRFNALVSAKKAFLKNTEQQAVLSAMMHDAAVAVKKDPRGETIKEILLEVKKAIEANLLTLKEKERQKKIGALDTLLSTNFFDSFFWKLNEAEASINEIEKKLSQSTLYKSISDNKQTLSAIEKQLEQAKIEKLQKEQEQQKKLEHVAALKQNLEASLKSAFNKTIVVSVDWQ